MIDPKSDLALPAALADPRGDILPVDDDPAAVHALAQALSRHVAVRFATNTRDARARIAERLPDLIFLDVEMPGEHGFVFCRALKADAHTREIPIIFVTAHQEPEFQLSALAMGAADFLTKPISPPLVQLRARLHLQLKAQIDQLRHLAVTDPLTGLHNRRAFDEAMTRAWSSVTRQSAELGILFVDIDHFKLFNDAYGHLAGDECLRAIGGVLRRVVRRPEDCAARLGGEEFVLLLVGATPAYVNEVAESVRESIARLNLPHVRSTTADHVTASVGALHAGWPRDVAPGARRLTLAYEQARQWLLAETDKALYAAKAQGRNRVVPATVLLGDLSHPGTP